MNDVNLSVIAASTVGGVFASCVFAAVMTLWVHGRYTERERGMRAQIETLRAQLIDAMDRLAARNYLTPSDVAQVIANGDKAYSVMRTQYSREDLEVLAADIGLSIEDYGGEGVPVVAHRLVEAARKRGVYDKLLATLRRDRPGAFV